MSKSMGLKLQKKVSSSLLSGKNRIWITRIMEPEAKKKKKFCSGSGEVNNLPTWKSCSLHPLLPSAGQFHSSSVAQLCPTLCSPMDHSTTGLPVHHQHPEFTQTHEHWVGDAIQPSHPLSSPSPPAINLCQHQGLYKWVSSSHHVAKELEFQLQHQSFQRTPKTDLL